MSLFTRALAGAGTAAAGLANKYIDEELAQQRAAALADIQVKTAATMRADADAFNNDPTRIARDRANKVADLTAEGTTRNSLALEGARAVATDSTLQTANAENAARLAGATTKATTEAQLAAEMKKLTDPAYISAERKLALARHIESAGSVAQAALANFQLGAAKEMLTLRRQLAEAQTTGNKDAAESIQAQIDALDGKGGKVDKFYAIAEKATAGMAGANKILNDPMATPEAKDEANAQIRQQRAILEAAAKRAGISDIADARYAKPPDAAVQALLKNPDKAADFDAKYGAGASKKLLGDMPAGAGARKPLAQVAAERTNPSDQLGMERLTAAAAPKGYTRRGQYFQKGGTGVLIDPADVAKELGLEW